MVTMIEGRGLWLSPFSFGRLDVGRCFRLIISMMRRILVTVLVCGDFPAAGVGERAGHEAVERGALRRDGEGLDGRRCDSQRRAAGGGAGDFPALCDREELCVVDGERCGGERLCGAGRDGVGVGGGDAGDAGWKGSQIFEGKELAVQALRVAADGSVLVATSPDGKVYRVPAGGGASGCGGGGVRSGDDGGEAEVSLGPGGG